MLWSAALSTMIMYVYTIKEKKSLPYTEKPVIVNDKKAYNFAKVSSNWGKHKQNLLYKN
jgi:hypothetical protein